MALNPFLDLGFVNDGSARTGMSDAPFTLQENSVCYVLLSSAKVGSSTNAELPDI